MSSMLEDFYSECNDWNDGPFHTFTEEEEDDDSFGSLEEDDATARSDCPLAPVERGVEVHLEEFQDVVNTPPPVEIVCDEEGIATFLEESSRQYRAVEQEQFEVSLDEFNTLSIQDELQSMERERSTYSEKSIEYEYTEFQKHNPPEEEELALDPVWLARERPGKSPVRKHHRKQRWWKLSRNPSAAQTTTTANSTDESVDSFTSSHDSPMDATLTTIIDDEPPLFRVSELAEC